MFITEDNFTNTQFAMNIKTEIIYKSYQNCQAERLVLRDLVSCN